MVPLRQGPVAQRVEHLRGKRRWGCGFESRRGHQSSPICVASSHEGMSAAPPSHTGDGAAALFGQVFFDGGLPPPAPCPGLPACHFSHSARLDGNHPGVCSISASGSGQLSYRFRHLDTVAAVTPNQAPMLVTPR